MGGLALLLSKGKMSKDAEPSEKEMDEGEGPDSEKEESGLEEEYLKDAFEAVKGGDFEAFSEAMLAFKQC